MRFHWQKTSITVLLLLYISVTAAYASATAWDLILPVPGNDARWQQVADLWGRHWDGENIGDIIAVLHEIEAATPDQMAVNLWLSQAYYLKARYQKSGRVDALKQSEAHAVKAAAIDGNNPTALKLLITAVSSYADFNYIQQTYGEKFADKLPAPVGRALPLLDTMPGFMEVIADWDRREDFEKAQKAVARFREVADAHPDNIIAQIWVARGNYYLGYYWVSLGDPKTALPFFKQGEDYAKKALHLNPHNVPATYWRQLNLSRSIEHANIFVKARYLSPIMDLLVFTANENMTYFYCGPLISTATIIEKGGWLAEKGLGLAGYNMETVETGLKLAVLAYPSYFYTHFARAEVLYQTSRKNEAKTLMQQILAMDPYQSPFHAPENLCVQRLARAFLAEHY
ncbi:MAG: hypothetical protein SWH61_17715 [Thermodesulfobacteriota bacterium]|nr:hypothetical protein [Thermodesulfobacteriota bacterium]